MDSRNEFTRNRTSKNIVNKLIVLIRIFFLPLFVNWSKVKYDISEFTTTTRLFFQRFTVFNCNVESLFVSNLRSTLVNFNFKLSTHTVNDDLKVQLSHSAKNCLTCFFICIYTKCWIFFNKLSNGHTHFINVCLCFWFNCNCDYWLWNKHVLQSNWMVLITKSVTRFDFFKSNCSSNITSLNEINRILLISKHLHDTADTLFFTTSYVQNIRTCIQVTRVCAEECQTTNKWVSHDFECQRSKWFFWI